MSCKAIWMRYSTIATSMFGKLGVDPDHAYVDGTKIEANANKYTWGWKKSCIKSRREYVIEYVEYILCTFLDAVGMTTEDFIHGKYHLKKLAAPKAA